MWQEGRFVYGVVGGFDYLAALGGGATGFGALSYSRDLAGALQVKVGALVTPDVLLYAKAGGAWAHDVYNIAVFNSALPSALGSATPSGWTAGLGLEWAFFGGNFTAFAEYDYASFGTTRVNYTAVAAPGFTFPLDVRQSVNLFLFGINYRFGPAGGY